MTKKLVKMLKYTVYNLVKFAGRLASRRAWIEISHFFARDKFFFWRGGTFYALNTQGNLCEISEKIVG